MDLIKKSEKIIKNIKTFKDKNYEDLKEIKLRLKILEFKEYETSSSYLDEFMEKKINIIKQFKTNIFRLEKFITLNKQGNFVDNIKFKKQCKLVLNNLDKYDSQRKEFQKELKRIDKKYESEYEKDIFNLGNFKKNREKVKNKKDKEEIYKNNKKLENEKEYNKLIDIMKKKVNSSEQVIDKELKSNLVKLKNSIQNFDNNLNESNIIENKLQKNDSIEQNQLSNKRKIAKKKVTNLIMNNNINSTNIVKRKENRNKTKKINLIKGLENNLEINPEIYIKNKEYINYNEEEKISFRIHSLRFPLLNTQLIKLFIKILDENFTPLSLKENSVLCKLNSNENDIKFEFTLNLNLNNCPCENIYIMIIFTSFYTLNNVIINYPVTWGFSLFNLNDYNNISKIKNGYFQIPIYLPCYLRLNYSKLKNIFIEKKLDLIRLSSLLVSCFSTNKTDFEFIDYNTGLFNNIDFNPTKFELALMTKIHKKMKNLDLQTVKKNLIGFKNLSNKNKINTEEYNEEMDIYLQLKGSTIIDYTQCFELLDNLFNLDVGVKALINPHKQFNYKIKATFMSIDLKENVFKEKAFFSNKSEKSLTNFIIFKEKYHTFKNIRNTTDMIIFKIYYLYTEENKIIKSVYGYSILPIFYNEFINLNGYFLLPIIMNKVNFSVINMITKISPFTYCNDLANGFIFELCKIRDATIIVSIKDNNIIPINDYDDIDFNKINTMFMPIKQEKLYSNIRLFYNKSKNDNQKINKTENNNDEEDKNISKSNKENIE